MSAGEIIGLALTTALIGGALGAGLAGVLANQRERLARRRQFAAGAHARWLAARWTANRAALSFVAAFRALAAERRDADNYSLREQEAQRARAKLCEAMDALDREEATLQVLTAESVSFVRSVRIDADELRAVIQGDLAAVVAFRDRLGREDQRAAAFVRSALREERPLVSRLGTAGLLGFVRRITDRWSR